MKQEFDMVKALHTLTYDLESQSGQYNIGKMFSECLDKAANAGVEITDADISLEIVKKKLTELELAISDKNEQETEVIFGELLLSCCNLSRIIKKDSEKALTFAINKFIMRFRELERDTVSQGKTLDNLSDEQVKALFLSSD